MTDNRPITGEEVWDSLEVAELSRQVQIPDGDRLAVISECDRRFAKAKEDFNRNSSLLRSYVDLETDREHVRRDNETWRADYGLHDFPQPAKWPMLGPIVGSSFEAERARLSIMNLLPLAIEDEAKDGNITVCIHSKAEGHFTCARPYDRDSSTRDSAVTILVLGLKQHIDLQSAPEPDTGDGVNRNLITALCYLTLYGEYEWENTRRLTVRVNRTTAGVATSHVVSVPERGEPTKREFDVLKFEDRDIITLRPAGNYEACVRITEEGSDLAIALNILHSLNPRMWYLLCGNMRPPRIPGSKIAYSLRSVMRNALYSVCMYADMESAAIVAEATACLGRVEGMSDESLVESMVAAPRWYACQMKEFECRPVSIETASWVDKGITSGIITFELVYSRLLNCLTEQQDYARYERLEHAKELERKSVPGIKVVGNRVEVGVARVMSTHNFSSEEHAANYRSQQRWPSNDVTGHTVYETIDSTVPLMRRDIMATRDLMLVKSISAAKIRRAFDDGESVTSRYAYSTNTAATEYDASDGVGKGRITCTVEAPRPTMGAVIQQISWCDTLAVLDGSDRSGVLISNGTVIGREARVISLATELKRRGFELRVNENTCLGIGNTRKDYGFSTSRQSLIAVNCNRMAKALSNREAQSEVAQRLAALFDVPNDQDWFACMHRRACAIVATSGVLPAPKAWHIILKHHQQRDIYGRLVCALVKMGENAHASVLVKHSSIERDTLRPGGFSTKKLERGAGARLYNHEGEAAWLNGDAVLCGHKAYAAVTARLASGYTAGEHALLEAFDMTVQLAEQHGMTEHFFGPDGPKHTRDVYEQPLRSYPRGSLRRSVWHAATGAITLMAKYVVALNCNGRTCQPSEAPHDTCRIIRMLPEYRNPSVRCVLVTLISGDLGWTDITSSYIAYCIAIDRGRASDEAAYNRTLAAMKRPYQRLAAPKCPNKGRCLYLCNGTLIGDHVCAKCHKRNACPECRQATLIANGSYGDIVMSGEEREHGVNGPKGISSRPGTPDSIVWAQEAQALGIEREVHSGVGVNACRDAIEARGEAFGWERFLGQRQRNSTDEEQEPEYVGAWEHTSLHEPFPHARRHRQFTSGSSDDLLAHLTIGRTTTPPADDPRPDVTSQPMSAGTEATEYATAPEERVQTWEEAVAEEDAAHAEMMVKRLNEWEKRVKLLAGKDPVYQYFNDHDLSQVRPERYDVSDSQLCDHGAWSFGVANLGCNPDDPAPGCWYGADEVQGLARAPVLTPSDLEAEWARFDISLSEDDAISSLSEHRELENHAVEWMCGEKHLTYGAHWCRASMPPEGTTYSEILLRRNADDMERMSLRGDPITDRRAWPLAYFDCYAAARAAVAKASGARRLGQIRKRVRPIYQHGTGISAKRGGGWSSCWSNRAKAA
jgi:hypothetical protein